jgi:hypothetical protein
MSETTISIGESLAHLWLKSRPKLTEAFQGGQFRIRFTVLKRAAEIVVIHQNNPDEAESFAENLYCEFQRYTHKKVPLFVYISPDGDTLVEVYNSEK